MSTLSDAMDSATAELLASRLALDALRTMAAMQLALKTTAAQTVINNFLGRPPVATVFCDPVNGDDTHDGLSVATAKKSLDAILDGLGTTATTVFLLADTIIKRRRNVYPSLTINGAQAANNAQGYIPFNRTLGFLGIAENSPIPGIGTFCSGLWLLGPNFSTANIITSLPDQPAGQSYTAHITSSYGTAVQTSGTTLVVSSPAAGELFGCGGNTLNAFLQIALGSGAAGHLFTGIAAGANPNASFSYRSNITSA